MQEFFDLMDPVERVYWYIAIAASLIFVIQSILTIIGADADTGVDADFDGNFDGVDQPFGFFSFRNFINFFLGFGWAGVAFYDKISNTFLLGLVAFIIGCIFVGIFFLIMRAMFRLTEDNTVKVEDTIGKTAEVYLTIPANATGKGKVQVSVRGSTRELAAITKGDKKLESGAFVKVVAVEENILIVEAI